MFDVPRLLARVGRPPPVEYARAHRFAFPNGLESGLFLNPDVRVGRVAQNEKVEAALLAEFGDRSHRGDGHAKDTGRVLIIGTNEERGFARKRSSRIVILRIDERSSHAKRDNPKSGERRHEGKREPENVDREKHHQSDFERRKASHAENEVEFTNKVCRDGEGASEDERSAPKGFPVGPGLAAGGAVETIETLRRKNRLHPGSWDRRGLGKRKSIVHPCPQAVQR